MEGLVLAGYRALELSYRNNIKGNNVQVALEYDVKTKALFHRKESTCECFYDLIVNGKKEEKVVLQAHVRIAGLFDVPKDVNDKEIHAAAANELYPYVRAALVGLTSIAAIAPLPWPHKQIKIEDLSEENKILN